MKSAIGLLLLSGVVHAAQGGSSLGTSKVVERGEKLFAQGCAVGYCHGSAGAAARSPRLRGRTFEADYLTKVIRDGIPNSAMPAWGDRLTDEDISTLVTYIQSLSTASPEGPAPAETTASAAPPIVSEDADLPAAVRRGKELFADPHRGAPCADCHRLQSVGVQVGPDLAKLPAAQLAAPAGAIGNTGRAKSVRTVITKDGDRFPGVLISSSAQESRYYDLTTAPPVQRNLLASEIRAVQRDSNWSHAKAVKPYNADELGAVWEYVRWAVQGRKN